MTLEKKKNPSYIIIKAINSKINSSQYTLIIPHRAIQLTTKVLFFKACKKHMRAKWKAFKLITINRHTGLKRKSKTKIHNTNYHTTSPDTHTHTHPDPHSAPTTDTLLSTTRHSHIAGSVYTPLNPNQTATLLKPHRMVDLYWLSIFPFMNHKGESNRRSIDREKRKKREKKQQFLFDSSRWWRWWLLLRSAILRYRADSLRSHVILHEWLYGFLKRAFEYPPKWCTYNAGMAGATWNCCRLCASSVYTIQPCTMSFYAKPHTLGVCESSCNLPHALLAEWSRYFTCYCGNTGAVYFAVYS